MCANLVFSASGILRIMSVSLDFLIRLKCVIEYSI